MLWYLALILSDAIVVNGDLVIAILPLVYAVFTLSAALTGVRSGDGRGVDHCSAPPCIIRTNA